MALYAPRILNAPTGSSDFGLEQDRPAVRRRERHERRREHDATEADRGGADGAEGDRLQELVHHVEPTTTATMRISHPVERMASWYENSLFGPIADDIAGVAPPGTAVLEVGCGSGALSIRLAADHGLASPPSTWIRTKSGAPARRPPVPRAPPEPSPSSSWRTWPRCHWRTRRSTSSSAPSRCITGTTRRPDSGRSGGCFGQGRRALIWDLRRGFSLFHLRTPDPLDGLAEAPLELRDVREWAWPFGFTFFRRLELARPLEPATPGPATAELA